MAKWHCHQPGRTHNNVIMKKLLTILGSTGSIGTQTLDVVRMHNDRFEVYALTANNNVQLLIKQALEFKPEVVVIANECHYNTLKCALKEYPIKVYAGAKAIEEVASISIVDIVVTAMVGYSGLAPTIAAIKAGKRIALANKETLVVAGNIITELTIKHKATILPVDSEHGAIFQCLQGEDTNVVNKLILTASGGPFRTYDIEKLRTATAKEALSHPTWSMGNKITIDSASLMNKGFEMIEAKWLFGVDPDQIKVIIHPQSIIHSMIEYKDGSIKAQLGETDMRLPIQYALTYPERIKSPTPFLDFTKHNQLTFEEPDFKRFRNLEIAYQAMKQGGNLPCIINAANEVVVDAFLHDNVGFIEMSDIIEKTINRLAFISNPTYEDYVACDAETRIIASEFLK